MYSRVTSEQKELLKILNCYIHGKSCELSEDFFAFDELYRMSLIQRVSAAVFETVCQDGRLKDIRYQEMMNKWRQHAIRQISLQTQKTYEFLELYQQMCDAGLRPLVVKGIIRRQMYDKPDTISSSDEDLLIDRTDFRRCDGFLLRHGFQRPEVDLDNLPMEVSYLHPETLLYLEVHIALFSEETGSCGDLNLDFARAFETSIFEKIQGVCVWTLEPTLHMWYLICHSLKHFLHSGFGIRQICDMVKMAEYYGKKIAWNWIGHRLKTLGLERYWGAIVDIAGRYLGFEVTEEICSLYIDGTELLLDLFEGGIYGSSSLARRQSSNMTLTAAKKGRKDTFGSLWNSLFPGRAYMLKKYSYLKQHPWMLPAAWLQRFRGYVKAQKNTGSRRSIHIGMQRVELLRKYGLIRES